MDPWRWLLAGKLCKLLWKAVDQLPLGVGSWMAAAGGGCRLVGPWGWQLVGRRMEETRWIRRWASEPLEESVGQWALEVTVSQ